MESLGGVYLLYNVLHLNTAHAGCVLAHAHQLVWASSIGKFVRINRNPPPSPVIGGDSVEFRVDFVQFLQTAFVADSCVNVFVTKLMRLEWSTMMISSF